MWVGHITCLRSHWKRKNGVRTTYNVCIITRFTRCDCKRYQIYQMTVCGKIGGPGNGQNQTDNYHLVKF